MIMDLQPEELLIPGSGCHFTMLTILWLQLFRKALISAMKLPDNEPLEAEDYWTVTDTWKQEWERGVQVEDKYKIQNTIETLVCNT